MNEVLEAALRYASLGLKVFPLRDKRPIPANGMLDGTTNKGIINAWFEDEDGLSVGVVIPETVVVVDVDSAEALGALRAFGYDLPATVQAKTRRGSHHYYKVDRPIKRTIKALPDVDILSNGYVLVPPSVHATGRYEWVTEFAWDSLADAPGWVLTYANAEDRGEASLDAKEALKGIPEGERQVTLFRHACKYRGLGNVSKEEATLLIQAMADKSNFTEQTGKFIVDRVWKNYPDGGEEKRQPVKVWKLSELLDSTITRPKDWVTDMIPQGVTLLSGDPKAGKSYLAQQIGWGLASGGQVLMKHCQVGEVLQMDLEQSDEYGKARWEEMIRGDRGGAELITIAYEWNRMDNGGLKDIESYLTYNSGTRLIVVDTLSQIWPMKSESSFNAYHAENIVLSQFRKLYKQWGVSFLLVHHNSKGKQDSKMKSASGTQAMTGACDAVLTLSEANLPELQFDGKLYVTGKNIKSSVFDVRFDQQNAKWIRR